MKYLITALTILHFNCIFAADISYQTILKNELGQQTQRVTHYYDITKQSTKEKQFSNFPTYQQAELDQFLTAEFGAFYDGHHPLIDEYIDFFTSQPQVNMRVLFGLFETLEHESSAFSAGSTPWMRYLFLSRINLMPKEGNKNAFFSVGMNPLIAAHYGVEMTDFVDDRVAFPQLIAASNMYLNALKEKFAKPSDQLGALLLGANTIRKAHLKCEIHTSYWELYPFLDHKERDFYPAMLAAAFVWSKRHDWGVKGYELQPKWNSVKVISPDTIHFQQFTQVLELDDNTFHLFNARYYKKIVLPGHSLFIPLEKQQHFESMKDSIYSHKREVFFPKENDSCYVFYRTERGEYFRDLTHWFGPSLEEIKKLNGFTSNTLPKRWDVFFKVPCSDSSFFAEFDNMNNNQKDAAARGEKVPQVEPTVEKPIEHQPSQKHSDKKITYTVKSGDTLWGIGQKYNVTDAEIMDWNNIDIHLKPGQKLIIYLP